MLFIVREYTQSVTVRILWMAAALGALLLAQESNTRAKASDYPVHSDLASVEIGAEYLVHSIPTENGFYETKDYLVVEVAMFPTSDSGVLISSDQFRLRMNGKQLIFSQPAGVVAASMKYSDWNRQRGTAVSGGLGDSTVTLGPPAPAARFPGDQRAGRPYPVPPNPSDPSGGNVEKEPVKPVEVLVQNAALPEGPATKPVKGCLFFPFQGKTKSIRSLELVYDRGAGAEPVGLMLVR